MTVGWIKLYRLLLEKEIFQNAYVLKTFIYLLLKAAYKESSIKVGNRNIELQPGQLLYGRKCVSQKLNMGEGKLRGIMEYLMKNGSIEMESYSKYSIVTIVNWEQYQKGASEPEFPFDVDFLDDDDDEAYEEYPKSQPAENQLPDLLETDFPDFDDVYPAISQPQYNKNNKINNNKTIKNKTKENKNTEISENTQNIENISYRQSERIINDDYAEQKVAGSDTSQDVLLSGGGVSKGNVGCGDSADIFDAEDSSEAFSALSTMDDAALDVYFASCSFADNASVDYGSTEPDVSFEPIPLDDSDMPHPLEDYRRPGHDFAAEMTYSLSQQDIDQLEAMFSRYSVAAVGYPACAKKDNANQNNNARSINAAAPYKADFAPDPCETEYLAARRLFHELWNRYPIQLGKEKVSDAQIMRLYEVGEHEMKRAIFNYKNKKHRVPEKYWMHGSTFFNGGYEKYL